MSAEVAQVLRDAKALIANPVNWTQGDYEALDVHGNETGCFCAVGAVLKAVKYDWDQPAQAMDQIPALNRLIAALPFSAYDRSQVENWNDEQAKHADVMALFDRAIAAEEASA